MANFAKIEIVFESVIAAGDDVVFSINGQSITMTSVVGAPSNEFEFEGGSSAADSCFNLYDALPAALATFAAPISTMEVSIQSLTRMTVEATEYGVEIIAINGNGYSVEITPEYAGILITSITPAQAQDNPTMTHVRHSVTVENEEYPFELYFGALGFKVCTSASDLFFEFPRFTVGTALDLNRIAQAVIPDSFDNYTIPNVSTYEHGGISVLNGLTTGNATVSANITNAGDIPLIFQYALYLLVDNVETTFYPYQSSNVFADLPLGVYRSYITDQFGGIVTAEFQLVSSGTEIGQPDPYFRIENANSLKFYNENEGIFDGQKFVEQAYTNVEMQCYAQKLRQTDAITTQIKTTYRQVEANILDIDGNIAASPVPVIKVQNTRLKDKRDCNFWRSTDALKTYITFDGGNTYTPDTSTITGTYYPQNGALPSWAQTGMFVEIPAGTFEVVAIEYITSLSRWALVVESVLSVAGPVAGQCQSNYNVEPYDIWEVTCNFSALPEGIYYVVAKGFDADPNYTDIVWTSEIINLQPTHDNTVVIDYRHDSNISQMDYSTGIINRLLVPARFIKWRPKIDSERFTTDSGDSISLKSVQRRVVYVDCVMVPQYLAEKITIAAGHNDLKINGNTCVLVEDPEVEDKIDDRNPFYNITLQMQVGEGVVITDNMGVVSESAAVLGSSSSQVIGI